MYMYGEKSPRISTKKNLDFLYIMHLLFFFYTYFIILMIQHKVRYFFGFYAHLNCIRNIKESWMEMK